LLGVVAQLGGRVPQDCVDAIRRAGDIVRLISDYVPLKPAGARYKGLCPFHQEKTPSFSVDPKLQLVYCFGCQTGGDLFKFVMLHEKVGFTEAVELLARRWSVPLTSAGGNRRDAELDRLAQINRQALAFFREQLAHPARGRRGRDYLERRALTRETVELLQMGYAPESWNALRDHLVGKGASAQDLLRAGLVLPRKNEPGEYDRFRDRVIFPIHDVSGRLIAFGGRAVGADQEPKYLNSPETPLYVKGEHLYGLDQARDAIRREGMAIVVEGYLDLAAVVQAGFQQVVASLGTSFTEGQARLLARHTQRVVFSYDGDSAGASATERSLGLLLGRGFEVRVIELPRGLDPDDYLRREGAAAYGQLLRRAPEYLEFLIQRESRERDLRRLDERVAGVNAVLPYIARLSSAIERGSWAARLADALQLEDALVLQELRAAARGARTQIRQRPNVRPMPREAECRLVHRLLLSEAERRRWATELDLADLEGATVLPIVRAIIGLSMERQPVDYTSVTDRLAEESDKELLTRIAFRDEPEEGPSVEDCLWAFKRKRLVREGKKVLREIGSLGERTQAPPAELDQRLERLQQLARQRDALS
jgi:DNA primase